MLPEDRNAVIYRGEGGMGGAVARAVLEMTNHPKRNG
jgi:hypothetical protein